MIKKPRLVTNLQIIPPLAATLVTRKETEHIMRQEAEQRNDQETSVSDKSPNNSTFVIEEGGEEACDTYRSILSLSMMQSTIEDNLACIREMKGGGEWSHREETSRSPGPLPAMLPDLGQVLADLGLELD